MKTKIILLLLALGWMSALFAQQEPQYTHFMMNKLAFNPAYAGSQEVLTISGLARMQWLGMERAPQTQTLYAHSPIFSDRVGIGGGLIHDTHGAISDYRANLAYAYRFPLMGGNLSLGLQGALHVQQVRWTTLEANETGDNAVPTNNSSKFLPNFGTGVYYYSDRMYAGLSIPNLLRNNLIYGDVNGGNATEVEHVYFMTGAIFGDKIKVKPGILFKYAPNAPLDFDANVSVLFSDQFWVGLTYRLDDAIAAMVGYQMNGPLRLGVSYDYTLSPLNNFNNGSIEAFVEYAFRYGGSSDSSKPAKSKNKFINPRFFF